ncbi:MAG: rhodanese-like domain-containing protein [Mariprofundaceae bacterium]|nr:rhodanese-like domain-containing protein [Mariprofundaceae bacterium]
MKQISVNDLYPKWLSAKEGGEACTIIDVREVGEYQQAHVPNVALIVLNTVPQRSDEIPSEGDVYVICRSGGRSAQAIQFLEQNYGHQNLINVSGGTMAWMQENYPVDQGK